MYLTGEWDYSELPDNVRLGDECFIERRASFEGFRSERDPGLALGNRVRAYTWTEFNVEPQGVIEVGDDSLLVGPHFMCAELISIGKRVIVSYGVVIADCDFHPHDPELRKLDAVANAPHGDKQQRPPLLSRSVTIEDDVWIGIGAFILKGVRIGAGAVIDAGAIVTSDVPSEARVSGNPARVVARTDPAS